MSLAIAILGAIAAVALVFHVVSIGIAIWRCRSAREPVPAGPDAPLVSIIRPLCGEENFLEDTLRSGFVLDYPRYELLFCVGTADDPAVSIARRLMDAYPHVPARVLVGNEVISENPKLNNTYKGWRAAEADWVIMADSNVLMPPDYVQRLQRTWQSDTGLVCSPPVGCWPTGFWAEVECAFLNTYQARWQLAADGVGQGFAQGKNMLWRRRDLELWGGIRALGAELAEDAAGTKLVRAAGLRVRVVDAPFSQPLGGRDAAAVWKRQVRWARLRRAAFSAYFALEILVGSALPLIALTLVVLAADASPAWIFAFAAFWYACEAVLARAVGWHMRAVSPLAWITRDLLLPLLYVAGWAGSAFVWRGNEMRTAVSKA